MLIGAEKALLKGSSPHLINGEGEFFTLDSSYHINELHFHTGTRSDSYEWAWPLHSLLWCLLIWCCNLWTHIRPAPLFQYAWKGPGKCVTVDDIVYICLECCVHTFSLSLDIVYGWAWFSSPWSFSCKEGYSQSLQTIARQVLCFQ